MTWIDKETLEEDLTQFVSVFARRHPGTELDVPSLVFIGAMLDGISSTYSIRLRRDDAARVTTITAVHTDDSGLEEVAGEWSAPTFFGAVAKMIDDASSLN